MSINKPWLQDERFARSIKRQIDKETLIDLLGIVIYEVNRSSKLEDAGFADQASSIECLFNYVLDALEIPPSSDTFSREPFEKFFYNDYWLEHQLESLEQVVGALEVLRETTAENRVASSANAEARRANLRVVDADNDYSPRQ